jgi:DNA polymerase/3'-5' exonuclease PolX
LQCYRQVRQRPKTQFKDVDPIFSVNYKQQEQTIMAKLDNVEKHTGKGKKGSIGDAAGDNDAIRQWVSLK